MAADEDDYSSDSGDEVHDDGEEEDVGFDDVKEEKAPQQNPPPVQLGTDEFPPVPDSTIAALKSGGRHNPGVLRGYCGRHGDDPTWQKLVERFPNGVPRFLSKEEGQEWTVKYILEHGGSNPDFPHLRQSCTTFITWEQIEKYVLPEMVKARKEPSTASKVPKDYGVQPDDTSSNIYERSTTQSVMDGINFRLDLPIHQSLTPASVLNTLGYLFFHMKCGIYVMIRNHELRIFAPFANRDYRNTWKGRLKIRGDKSVQEYYDEKLNSGYRKENVIETDRWWANGNIICNELDSNPNKKESEVQVWGDQFLLPMRDMIAEACRKRQLPDCEFFLNKRDYPQLKVNVERGIPVEPYGFIYDRDDRNPEHDIELERCKFNTYAPILSFYAARPDRFADIPCPSSEDWEGACGEVFPRSFQFEDKDTKNVQQFYHKKFSKPRDLFTEENFRKFEKPWNHPDRRKTAFFRGTATGGGITVDTNQRIKCSYLSHLWKNDPVKGVNNGSDPYLDSAIVGWNRRDKKEWDTPMTCLLNPEAELGFEGGKKFFTPIYEQSTYKYLVYIDGHCAACRYGFMMRLGSVILKVEARQVADTMWYFPLLEPGGPDYPNATEPDHIPIKDDLSDLEEKIRWCREHDAECEKIAANCLVKYNSFVARDGLLDYMEMVTKSIARRQVDAPGWWQPPPTAQPPPQLAPPNKKCMPGRQERYCARCQSEIDEEQRKKQEEEEEQKAKEKNQQKSKEEKAKALRKRKAERAQKLREKEEAKKAKKAAAAAASSGR